MQPRLLAVAIGAHGLAAAFWFGSLVGLYASLRRKGAQALAALQRFSGLGLGAVAVLLAAGAGFAALQLHSLADLTQDLLWPPDPAKAGLLAVLLALAAVNRFVLMPRLARGAESVTAKLQRTIAAEIVTVVGC